MNQIEPRKNLFLDPNPTKFDDAFTYYDLQQLKTRIFRKNFLKYLQNFEMRTKDGSIKAKVKRAKIFRNCKDYTTPPFYTTLELRVLLKNQARFIKTLSSDHESPAQLLEKIKLFPNLRSIRLFFGQSDQNVFTPRGIEGPHLIKALSKIKRLRNVKNLEFNQLVNPSASLIHKIDASPRLLRRLETLGLSPCVREDDDDKVLEIIKDCKNLLKCVTSLDLPAFRSPSHLKSFQSLQNSCPNLRSLSFEFCNRDIICNSMKADFYARECFPVEINYLGAIKTFHNLRSLRLHIADAFTFLNDFVVPPLLQNLLLSFEECLTKEIMIRIDKAFSSKNQKQISELFETNPTLVKFYNNFKPLYHLKVLEMSFSSDVGPEDYQHHNYLSQGIIKRVPSLCKLTFVGGTFYWGLNETYKSSSVQDPYLPEFLTSCHPSRQTLQTLEIGHEKVIFSNFNLFSSRNKFPSLSTLTLTGAIDKNDPSNTEIGLFLKQVMTLGPSLTTIKLYTFVHATIKSLLSLLQQLSQLERPENLQLKLQIKFFEEKNMEDFEVGFEEIKKELQENQLEYPKLQGVSLILYTNGAKHARQFLEVYGKKFDRFKVYSLSYNLGYFK